MGTRYKIGALSLLVLCASDVLPAQAQARPPRDLLMGRDVRFELTGGSSPSGELLGVTADSLSVLVRTQGIQTLGFDQIVAMDVARHSFGWEKVWTWTAVGALVSGVGLTAACSSLDEGDRAGDGSWLRLCGGVFGGTVLSWGLVGGIFGAIINSQRWRAIAPSPEAARPFSRYPQGIPDSVRER